MKVLFWLSIGLDRRTPSEHLLTSIIEALYKRGHTVHILQKDTGGESKELYPKLRELGVTTTKIGVDYASQNNLVSRYFLDIKYVSKCSKWIKNNDDFDRIFLQSSNVAGFQMRVLNKYMKSTPVVFNVQDLFPENAVYSKKISSHSLVYYFFSLNQKYAYKNASAILTISEDIKEELIRIGVDEKKIVVVYNWSYQDAPYDVNLASNKNIRKFLSADNFNVVYAGNIGLMQNVEVVIETARHSTDPSVLFHIFGDGAYKQRLIDKAKGLDNVRFWHMLPKEEAPALYSCADVIIVPLAPNIYRTALPSKTATCLAVHVPVIFCIGRDSIFAKKVEEKTGCPCLDSSDVEGVLSCIEKFRKGNLKSNTEDFFSEYMSMTKNSMKYAEVIENGISELSE